LTGEEDQQTKTNFIFLIKSIVKSRILVVSISSIFLCSLTFLSCKKINEATTLGDDLVPAVDNIHTFEVALNTVTNNLLFNDTTLVGYYDFVAFGDFNDPEFGHTHANSCFSISPSSFGRYPFVKNDSKLKIDSVVLSLSYHDTYGDTLNDGIQTLRVYEVDPNSGFNDTSYYRTYYRFSDPASDFATTGSELGSATFSIKNLKDSIDVVRPGDTSKVTNVVRIRLDNSLGNRFAQYDTINGSNGGFYSDSIFRSLFRGFSVKADPTGNALSYFSLSDITNTKLTVYYTYDTTALSFDFYHAANGQSNYINRENGGNYLAYLNNGATDKVYLQSAPGSYVNITIPSLSTFSNKTIHRAELVADKIPSAADNIFIAPDQLMLDRKNSNTPDTIFLLDKDLLIDASGIPQFSSFGGKLRPDNTVRFDISRYVQSVITKHISNDTLRMSAPLRTRAFYSPLNIYLNIPVNSEMAKGRLVLGGGTYADSTMRLRLRIIYSDL
jgi:hypothetical protein